MAGKYEIKLQCLGPDQAKPVKSVTSTELCDGPEKSSSMSSKRDWRCAGPIPWRSVGCRIG